MSYSPLSVRPGSSSASTRYHPYAPVPTRISTASPSQSSRGSSDMILPPMHGPSRTSTPACGMRTDTPQFRDDLPLDHSGFSFPRSDSHPGYGQYPDTGPVGHQLWDDDFPPHRNSSQSGYGASLPLQSLRAGDVDRIAGRHGLKPELVNRLHAFSQSSQQAQNSELYALLLQRQDEAADMRTAVTTLGKKIDELKQAYVSSFTPVPSAAVSRFPCAFRSPCLERSLLPRNCVWLGCCSNSADG
ncbi:hypothetical protein EXIGLDRAFT_717437 [Exidia glandulosa HHB12029]|uniref:Uncharacterized protein n=1 Tax=Exidia glandulosa HHB12029 TaxID=1314781 RepID=A0A165ICE0_EXIGL|nr:hypothetical protein EXIGLDRAFT_717437 [Exidia glandulosa HHB12029]